MALTSFKRAMRTGLLLAGAYAFTAPAAWAALADLTSTPINTQSTSKVQPNLMFVFDDSGSMDYQYLPDQGNGTTSVKFGFYGLRSAQCNGVYYNPAFNYVPPVMSTGVSYPNANFSAALRDGFNPPSGYNQTTNLGTSYKVSNGPVNDELDKANSAAYYYAYSGTQSGAMQTADYFKECAAQENEDPGQKVFTRVVVTGDVQQQNFANWYTYYRSRLNTMKTAAGHAFRTVDSNYRIGFMTINNNNQSNRPNFINVLTFDAAQRSDWYGKLYGTAAAGSTPLRPALATVGRMYANKIAQIYGGDVIDPMQYSCQQNFTLVSTDGFWNAGAGTGLDGLTNVGNTDGGEVRPYFDGEVPQFRAKDVTISMTTKQNLKSTLQVQKRTEQIEWRILWNGNVFLDWTAVSSCTPDPNGIFVVQCRVKDSDFVAAASCTESKSGGLTTTCKTNATGPTGVASCTNVPSNASAANNWVKTTCDPVTVGPTAVAACTASGANAANAYVTTTCATDTKQPVETSCTPASPSASNGYITRTCTKLSSIGGTSNTLADVAEYYYATDLRTKELGNCTGSPVTPGSPGNDVCENNVPQGGIDNAAHQHMTTFTLGLGLQGRMKYSENYQSAGSADYEAVRLGSIASSTVCTWLTPGSICNWPAPSGDQIETIDDLWHAAVNGRGTYFSASNPATLSAGLATALAGVAERTGGTAAVAVSNINLQASGNFVFGSTFTSGQWSSQLYRLNIAADTLALSNTFSWEAGAQLDARDHDERLIYTFDGSNQSTRLRQFRWANLTATEKSYFGIDAVASLSQLCSVGANCLPQWEASHAYAKDAQYRRDTVWYQVTQPYTSGNSFGAKDLLNTTVITGPVDQNLVRYLRGDRSNEGGLASAKFFRLRGHVLGDIVNADPVFVGKPSYTYLDAGYSAYVVAQKDRMNMVYAAANDGMLHAFKAGGSTITPGDGSGSELWAYMPTAVMPNLYKLADKSYATNHQYYVDGTPTMGDVYYNGAWRTILVGGLGGGGRGYYALDVTDPNNPKALWEFSHDTGKGAGYTTDANLGYSYGQPIITKLLDGTWVVMVSSGYNNGDNAASPGNGQGYLYVLNAITGAKQIAPIGTKVGSVVGTMAGCNTAPCPSNLGQIAQFATYPTLDNTALRVYGGDMYGNLWRFDVNDTIAPAGREATLLAQLRGPKGNYQPIMTKPIPSVANGSPVVIVNTGRLAGLSDLSDTSVQSVYAMRDTLAATGLGNLRENEEFVQQNLSISCATAGVPVSECDPNKVARSSSSKAVDFTTKKGWFLDLPEAGERSNVNMSLNLGTLVFNTNIPTSNACTAGGRSFQYVVNYLSGTATTEVVGRFLGNGLTGSPVVIEGVTGKVVSISQVDRVGLVTSNLPIQPGSAGVKRVSWRELQDQ